MLKQTLCAAAALAIALPAFADEPEAEKQLSAAEIVEAAPAGEWVTIAPEDLLVMTLAPDANGNPREVIIQLMPAPFSQGWIENIRALARSKWYDGTSVNRVQDNYVVQWGDPGYDNPESGETEQKPLPDGLRVMTEDEYTVAFEEGLLGGRIFGAAGVLKAVAEIYAVPPYRGARKTDFSDGYSDAIAFSKGFPVAVSIEYTRGYQTIRKPDRVWPVHCYGMVGVGRNYSPDTGTGAELYTVIGHAPRHLDRNIALVGRIIDGMHHLSSLPRGSGDLSFYTAEEANLRTPISSIRLASDLPSDSQPRFEYLSTDGEGFAAYAEARANRRDPFFITPVGGADICNIPVPIRQVSE